MPTLRIPVSKDLHHDLVELKGKMKADDWPSLMQCLVIESRWAEFSRPIINTILGWTQADPLKEPELLKKLGFVIIENIDGEGHTGVIFPTSLDRIIKFNTPGSISPTECNIILGPEGEKVKR